MGKTILSDWLWIDKTSTRVAETIANLRLVPEAYVGEAEAIDPWLETPTQLALPRVWGMVKYQDENIDADVSQPEVPWPAFQGTFRPGQQESVDTLHRKLTKFEAPDCFGGRFQAKAGSGKTVMSIALASRLNTSVLVICHKEDLMDQWRVAAEKFTPGVRVGKVQQDTWDYKDKHLTISSALTLYSRRDKCPADFSRAFGLVVFDESHRYAAEAFQNLLGMFPSRWRLGISATWRRRDGLDALWTWHLGQMLHEGSSEHLTGKYAQVPITVPWTMRMFANNYGEFNSARFITSVATLPKYNEWLVKQAQKAVDAGRKILIVSDRLVQLESLQESLTKAGIESGMYVGNTSQKGRAEAITKDVILGTYGIFAEGTDVPALDTLILATPRSDIEQVAGRIQRFFTGKKEPLIVDPVFSLEYAQALAAKRLRMYRQLGFVST